ncbi:hypothetical protein [Mycobacterium sp. 1465703.0]|uniref:hypothetical protein n=1 Tax=Mycobacterium sp. 1465703.0 TaxID=1834078 RepID=UPI0007FBB521|nr:hypothetical protein [Mycobacterium sp. 1465703.0]OBJ05243.1 hypothetical protein A5625_19795 [Mycobacterium sp. 1465703.0]
MIPALFPTILAISAAGVDTGSSSSFTGAIIVSLITSGGFWSVVLFVISRRSNERREQADTLTKSIKDLRRSSFLLIDAFEGMLVKLQTEDGGRTWSARLAGSEVDQIRTEIRTARSLLYEGQ